MTTEIVCRVSLLGEGDELPTEFRIFAAGKIETSKGSDLFDEDAARSVLAHYAQEGTDLMIDLEHDSIPGYDPVRHAREDACDARGWFNLELRGGELWAVNVRWSPDGERRLKAKTQRYISPVFRKDRETGRIVQLLNIALCSMPATYNAAPLVAANRVTDTRKKSRSAGLFMLVCARAFARSKKRATLAK